MDHEISLALLLTGLGETTGAVILVWGLTSLRQVQAMTAWPRVEGIILTSSYRSERYLSGQSDGEDASGSLYRPLITYEYAVNQRVFVGARLRPATGEVYPLLEAQNVAERYPPGRRVEVIHDPVDPSFAVLETGTITGAIAGIVGGTFFLVPSVAAMLLLLLPG